MPERWVLEFVHPDGTYREIYQFVSRSLARKAAQDHPYRVQGWSVILVAPSWYVLDAEYDRASGNRD